MNSLVGVTPVVKTPTVGAPGRRQVGVLHVVINAHLFLDGYPRLADPTLQGDLVREPRVHVHRLQLRHDLALSERTGRGMRCAHAIEGPTAASPPCFPAEEEA